MDQLFGAAVANGGAQLADPSQQMSTPTAIMVNLQYGSHRDKLILERSERPEVCFYFLNASIDMFLYFQAFSDFFRKAQQLVDRVMEEGLTTWSESGGELVLFRHDYGSMNMLQRLTNLVELVGLLFMFMLDLIKTKT
jgi:hypothetical protein